jgi:type IV pilus assembly protein PilC
MKLHYKAATKEGKVVQGVLDAKDIKDAIVYLRNKEFLPINIKKAESDSTFLSLLGKKSVKTNEIVLFTRQMSSMLSSGLTLIRCLELYRTQTQNEQMGEVIGEVIGDVEEGKSFSAAISKHPKVFSPIYVSLIKAGESSGLLDKVLLRLADNLEKQAKLKSTIKGAMMYPIIVVTLMVLVIFLMMIFVIPQLTGLYQNLNIELPLPTQIVIGLSNFISLFWPLIAGVAVGGLIFFNKWKKTEKGQTVIDALILKIPIFGKLTSETILTEFSRTFGLLVGTGTLIVEALNETADTTGNIYYKNAIKSAARQVEKGIPLGEAMSSYPLFPPMLVQLVKVGEQTGKVDESLTKGSEYYEREVNQTVRTLTTAMEPFIMVILGVGVAFLIISVITPIYSLISTIQ